MHSSLLRALVMLVLVGASLDRALADPPPPGSAESEAPARPGAAAFGTGTIFMTRAAIRAPESARVFLSQGKQLAKLDEPVGSCRLQVRVPGTQIPSGTPLTVVSVSATTSPYEDRGISSVRWIFEASDPAESLLCDTVGSNGPSQGDVEAELQGILAIEPIAAPTE